MNSQSGLNRDKLVVDELCNVIMKGCTLDEFKKAITELLQTGEEEKKEDDGGQGGADGNQHDFDFSTIGTKGMNMIHKACSVGNSEIVEYLLHKK